MGTDSQAGGTGTSERGNGWLWFELDERGVVRQKGPPPMCLSRRRESESDSGERYGSSWRPRVQLERHWRGCVVEVKNRELRT
jgi:hypothetical protein